MRVIETTWHNLPLGKDYAVFQGSLEQAKIIYQKRYGNLPDVVYKMKLYPSLADIYYFEFQGVRIHENQKI